MSINNALDSKPQLHDIAPLNDDTPLINRLTENEFKVHDIVAHQDFNVDLYNSALTPTYQFLIKELFVCLCGGWNNTELQTLSARKGTVKNWRTALLRIGIWASNNYPDLPMSRWTEIHVKKLLLDILENKIVWSDQISDNAPLGRGPVENAYLILRQSRKYKLKGILSDGLGFNFPKNFMQTSLEEKLKSYNISYHYFIKGGGYESIPLPIAMSLLHNADKILKDKKTFFLIDYFKYQRSNQAFSAELISNKVFDRYCQGEQRKINKNNILGRMDSLKNVIGQHYDGEVSAFPFSMRDLAKHCEDVYDACIIIFLCLTGIRVSELASLCADDYKVEIDGTWVFNSELLKTNHGISETREMHGLVAEAAQIMVDLSYIVKRKRVDKIEIPLFGRYFYVNDWNNHDHFRRTNRTESESSFWGRLNRTYDEFIQQHPEFESHCSSIHPHRFRHTWAEFALRRFEGNVFEAIRRHFRHSYGSYFTTHYVFGKLTDEVRDQIEKEYLKEILTKLATENVQATLDDNFKRDLHGKVAYYIGKSMDVTVLTETEIDDFVDDMAEEFESITAHEYGYCLVRKDMKHLAKCIDKKTQTPVLQNGCFDLCSGCINFVSSKDSNKDSITRIAVSHQNMIANFTNLMGDNVKSSAIDASKQTLKRAEEMLDEMEA